MFQNGNAWRREYFARFHFNPDVYIPTEDSKAYPLYPKHRWVYNKLHIAEIQGLQCAPFGISPPQYPIFSKPIYNISGMSVDARRFDNARDYESQLRAGTMWCELLEGDHYSVDLVIEDGKLHWHSFSRGIPLDKGMFDYWEINIDPPLSDLDYVQNFVATHLHDFRGAVNFEMIGGRIIEAHLRIAVQWIEIYGEDFLYALDAFYGGAPWQWQGEKTRGYSFAGFAPVQFYPDPSAEQLASWRSEPAITFLQFPGFAADQSFGTLSRPEGGLRLCVVNSTDFESGKHLRDEILREYGIAER